MKNVMKKKSKRRKSVRRNVDKYTLRVNSYLLDTFSYIGKNEYGINSASKFFINRLHYYKDLLVNEDNIYDEMSKAGFSSYLLDKIYSFELKKEEAKIFEEFCDIFSLEKQECFRKIVSFECSKYLYLYPKPYKPVIKEVEETTYENFYFWCSRELLNRYVKCTSRITKEDNLSVALNDAIKLFIKNSKEKNDEYLNALLVQPSKDIKNDFKYNFAVLSKRLEEFNFYSSEIGLKPKECLRKAIMLYLKENEIQPTPGIVGYTWVNSES